MTQTPTAPPAIPGVKTCRICGHAKPLDQFSPNKRMQDRHKNECKNCVAAYMANRRRSVPANLVPAARQPHKYVPGQGMGVIRWDLVLSCSEFGDYFAAFRGRTLEGLSLPCEKLASKKTGELTFSTALYYVDGNHECMRSESEVVRELTRLGIL